MAKSSSNITKTITDTKPQKTKKNREDSGNNPIGYCNPPKHTRFKKGQSGNPNGRKPKLWTDITNDLTERGYPPLSESQIINTYVSLLQLPKRELDRILKDEETPEPLQIVIKYMRSSRGMEMLDRVLDRSYGKVLMRQTVDANITTEQPLFGFTDNK